MCGKHFGHTVFWDLQATLFTQDQMDMQRSRALVNVNVNVSIDLNLCLQHA